MNQTQLQSLESEAGFRALFEYATVGILVMSNGSRIELANPTIEKIFGYTNGELIGKPVEVLIPQSFPIKHKHDRNYYFSQALTPPVSGGLNLPAWRKDGGEFQVEISLGYYELDGEELVVAFITDVSLHAAAEEKYRDMFENSLVAMFITDLTTLNIADVNETGVFLFGYQSKDAFIKHFKPSAHFVFPNERDNALTKEQEMRKLDGTPFWAKIFIKINHEKSIAQTAVLDITEVKRAHEDFEHAVEERTQELMQSLVREKELNELKSRFVSMASHEFRTPLSVILTSTALIEGYNKEDQEDKRKRHTDRIKASVSHLADILNDFLSLDKLEQGKVPVVKELFDLYIFSDEILEEINGLTKKGQQINFSHLGERKILSDKKILRNIVLNLLTNAIKYSSEDKEIYFGIVVMEDMISIAVRDEGIGIPEEEQKDIFSKFFRARNTNNIQGTGLGLNIVKRYVELLEGTIRFTSAYNVGTSFTIEIPLHDEDNTTH